MYTCSRDACCGSFRVTDTSNIISLLLQRVENYEYELPSDFDDEEIDEDTAFTEADKKQFADWFADEPEGDLPVALFALLVSVASWC